MDDLCCPHNLINLSSELQPVYALVVKIYLPRLERTVPLESSYPTSVSTETLEPAASVCVSLEKTRTGFTLKAEQSDSTRRFQRPWIERWLTWIVDVSMWRKARITVKLYDFKTASQHIGGVWSHSLESL